MKRFVENLFLQYGQKDAMVRQRTEPPAHHRATLALSPTPWHIKVFLEAEKAEKSSRQVPLGNIQ